MPWTLGADRAEMPETLGILIPSLDLQKTIDRIMGRIESTVLSVIGPNNNNEHPVYGSDYNFYRNKLRAEQRARLGRLLGNTD